MNDGYSTQIQTLPCGVKVRIDVVPCRLMTSEGNPCSRWKRRVHFEFKGPKGQLLRTATIVCEHQKDHSKTYWDEEMLLKLHEHIHSGKEFKEIDSLLRKDFPSVQFAQPFIKYRADGSYKEFDCPAKKKYEDMKLNKVHFDIWSYDVSRNEADDAVTWSEKSFYPKFN